MSPLCRLGHIKDMAVSFGDKQILIQILNALHSHIYKTLWPFVEIAEHASSCGQFAGRAIGRLGFVKCHVKV